MSVQHHNLMCTVRSLTYDFEARYGRLIMDEGNCCDMRACIAMFTAIDPMVTTIETIAGDVPDTTYVRDIGKQWMAQPGTA